MKITSIGLSLLLMSAVDAFSSHSAVTYSLSGGRFGDNLLAYCHAKWVSYAYKIPLLYIPFDYSDQLAMHHTHQDVNTQGFKRVHLFPEFANKVSTLSIDPRAQILYVIPYFPECKLDIKRRNFWHFDVGWDNKEFREQLRNELAPIRQLTLVTIPHNMVSVAVHVRSGSGTDKLARIVQRRQQPKKPMSKDHVQKQKFVDESFPLKFPPDEFYINQIRRISSFFDDKPLYVHIFTDHPNPEQLVSFYKQKLNKPNISFGFRPAGNNAEQFVLEDFFSLLSFDCLIRPESNYSIMAGKIGNFKMIISPVRCSWHGNKCVVDEIDVKMDASLRLR